MSMSPCTSKVEKLLVLGDPRYLQPSGEVERERDDEFAPLTPLPQNRAVWCDYHRTYETAYTSSSSDVIRILIKFWLKKTNFTADHAGLIGNVFHTRDIDVALEKWKRYNPDAINHYSQKAMGIDPGYGSGICHCHNAMG